MESVVIPYVIQEPRKPLYHKASRLYRDYLEGCGTTFLNLATIFGFHGPGSPHGKRLLHFNCTVFGWLTVKRQSNAQYVLAFI